MSVMAMFHQLAANQEENAYHCCSSGTALALPDCRCGLGFSGARTDVSGSGGSDQSSIP
jgi:hypothetical protein